MNDIAKCGLCGEPMPADEQMFKYHGFSGPCPKPLLEKPVRGKDPTWHKVPELKAAAKECVEMLLRAVEARDEHIAELEQERDELCAALSGQTDRAIVAEAEVGRLKPYENQILHDPQYRLAAQAEAEIADKLRATIRAVEGLPKKWRHIIGGRIISVSSCANELEAALKEGG